MFVRDTRIVGLFEDTFKKMSKEVTKLILSLSILLKSIAASLCKTETS